MQREMEQHKEVKIQQATPVYSTVNESLHQSRPNLSPPFSIQFPVNAQPKQMTPSWRKDFKVSGQIG